MTITLYEAGLAALLESPAGPVARNVTGRAEQVAELARQNVQANFRSRTGTLYNSIGIFPRETPAGLEVAVGTDGAPYGLLLETGTDPHTILPVNTPLLVSLPTNPDPLRAPRRQVAHPGMPPRPWLRPALEAVFTGG